VAKPRRALAIVSEYIGNGLEARKPRISIRYFADAGHSCKTGYNEAWPTLVAHGSYSVEIETQAFS
jgi:hypothetical protein